MSATTAGPSPAPEVTARRAVPDDAHTLRSLATAANRETAAIERGGAAWAASEARRGTPEGLSDLAGAADGVDPGRLVLLGCIDGVPVGYLAARTDATPAGPVARVTDLWVEEAARGVGVGAAMIDALLTWADREGCFGVDAWALPGERETKNFFEAAGFTARLLVVHRRLR